MIKIRRRHERGHYNYGWLDTYHTFSFNEYHDPEHMGFRTLRVINEDRVEPGQGFGLHGHKDMEILTYVLEGALEHKDSLGNGSILNAGMTQRMSAGTGIRHSEFNHSPDSPVHLYQIWIYPNQKNLSPEYEDKTFSVEDRRNRWQVIASPDGRDDSHRIHQDAVVRLIDLDNGREQKEALEPNHSHWLQIIRGHVSVNGHDLSEGDAIALSEESELNIQSKGDLEVMWFELG